jgi:hypothetical protein
MIGDVVSLLAKPSKTSGDRKDFGDPNLADAMTTTRHGS